MEPEVSVVIPTFNEEHRIAQTVNALRNIFSKHGINFEIIVSDGGSTDKTVLRVPKAKEVVVLKSPKFLPKGESLIIGGLKAKGRKIMFLDADLPISADDIMRLINETGKNDLVIASRYHPKSKGKYPKIRFILGRLFNIYVRKMLKLRLYDTQSGAKCLSSEIARKTLGEIENKGYAFDVELVLRVVKNRGRVKELPVQWEHKSGSRVKILKVMLELFFGVISLIKLRA
ncbi:MAG: glycosyltransferase [Candidatus Bathyarchaeia archaeon]